MWGDCNRQKDVEAAPERSGWGLPSPWGPFPDRRKHGGGANEMPRTGVVHAPSMPQAMLKWVLIGQIIT